MNLLSFLVENWIIVVPVVLFSFLVVLEECEVASESTVRTGGVPNSVLSELIGSSFPSGFYTYYSKETLPIFAWAFALSILGFVWVSTNIPELFSLAVVYAVLAIFVASISFAEIVAPKRTFFTAVVCFSGENVGSGLLFLMGLGIAAVFVPSISLWGLGSRLRPS